MTAQRLLILAVLITATFALFARWPGLDLWVTGRFYRPDIGFRADEGLANLFRLGIWRLSEGLLTAALAALILGFWTTGNILDIPRRLWAHIALLYLLGPGLLVDAILKPVWGRARPADVTQFGGMLDFTPPHVISGECARNCSFVSGEVAGAMALAISIWLILRHLRPHLSVAAYRAGVAVCLLLPFVTALQRIAAGRHFLSDSIISALAVLTVSVALHALIFRDRAR
jgi:lipid A 4'-phosphatase